MIKAVLCIFLGVLFHSLPAQQVLNLQDCRNLAIENNKKLKIAGKELEASRAQKQKLLQNTCRLSMGRVFIYAIRKRSICWSMMPICR